MADLITFLGSEPATTSCMISTTSFLSGKPPVWSLLWISWSCTFTSKAPLLPTFPFTTAPTTQLYFSLNSFNTSITYWGSSPVSSTVGPSCGWRTLRSRSILCGPTSTSFFSFLARESLGLSTVVVVVVTQLFLLGDTERSLPGPASLGQMISPTSTRSLINLI